MFSFQAWSHAICLCGHFTGSFSFREKGLRCECLAHRLANTIRVFKLLTLKDEYAYLLTDDYTALIDRIREKQVCETCPLPA